MAAWVGWRPELYMTALNPNLMEVSSEESLILVEKSPKTADSEGRLPAVKEEARQARRRSIRCIQRPAPRVRTVSQPLSV